MRLPQQEQPGEFRLVVDAIRAPQRKGGGQFPDPSNHNDAQALGAVDSQGEGQLDVRSPTGAGFEGNIGGWGISAGTEEVVQVLVYVLRRDDGDMVGRQ